MAAADGSSEPAEWPLAVTGAELAVAAELLDAALPPQVTDALQIPLVPEESLTAAVIAGLCLRGLVTVDDDRVNIDERLGLVVHGMRATRQMASVSCVGDDFVLAARVLASEDVQLVVTPLPFGAVEFAAYEASMEVDERVRAIVETFLESVGNARVYIVRELPVSDGTELFAIATDGDEYAVTAGSREDDDALRRETLDEALDDVRAFLRAS